MLNVGKIEEGFVLDHIQAGMAMSIYHHLQLDKMCIRDRLPHAYPYRFLFLQPRSRSMQLSFPE